MTVKQEIQDFSATPDGVPAHKRIIVPVDRLSTVEEVRKAKSELEMLLTTLVRHFETRTRCPVIGVCIKESKTETFGHKQYIVVEVRL